MEARRVIPIASTDSAHSANYEKTRNGKQSGRLLFLGLFDPVLRDQFVSSQGITSNRERRGSNHARIPPEFEGSSKVQIVFPYFLNTASRNTLPLVVRYL